MDIAAIQDAVRTIAGAAIRTPLVRLNGDHPVEIYLKLENLQPIGSFKIRGAANAIRHMPSSELARGVWTASAGNMAQGVAWMARHMGLSCSVIAPESAPDAKVHAVERLGGRVIKVPFDRWWQTFEERSYPGMDGAFVHPFDDDYVMAGNATIGVEIVEDLPDVDAILVPWGGGGLACGIASAVRALKPACRIIGVEAETAAPLSASLAAGSPQVVNYTRSFVDGIGSKTVMPRMFQRAKGLLNGSEAATLDEIRAAIRTLVTNNRVVAEGAGACPVAVALSCKVKARRIACVVSGGNIDLPVLREILS